MWTRLMAASVALAGLLTFAANLPALATEPVVVGPFREEGTSEFAECDGFTILDQYVVVYSQKRYFDQDGKLVRIVEDVSGTDTLINSTNGKSYTGRFQNTVIIDPATRLGATSGIIYRLTVPGAGAVLLDVGRVITDRTGTVIAFRAGPHQAIDGDIAGVCRALA